MEQRLLQAMFLYDKGDPKRIQHFVKVYEFAKYIGKGEKLDEKTYKTLKLAAIVHDIGIHKAEKKYGQCGGKLPRKKREYRAAPVLHLACAEKLLKKLGADRETIDRVCYLVGHHHTYTEIDGLDYQILIEADFLVNLYEDGVDQKAVRAAYDRIFKTDTGRDVCRLMFDL